MLIGGVVVAFVWYLVYFYQHPQPTEEQMQSQYNADKQTEADNALDDIKTSPGEMCSGTDISSTSCEDTVKNCVTTPQCFQMVDDYMKRNGITQQNRSVVFQASNEYIQQKRTQMGLPTLTEQQ